MSYLRTALLLSLTGLLIAFLCLLSAADAQTPGHLLISEVLYDAPQSGTDTSYEWVELFNPTAAAVNLAGWALRDNTSQDAIPAVTLGPGEYLVIVATAAGFAQNHPGFSGNLVTLEGSIGNGLSNTGDRVLLLGPDGAAVDAMSYWNDATIFDPPCLDVDAGWSLARVPSSQDTDSAADWLPQEIPNPGGPGVAPPPTPTGTPTFTGTPTPTATVTWTPASSDTPTASPTGTPSSTRSPTPTASPTASTAWPGAVVIDEIMQNPSAVSDAAGEWFELYNATAAAIDLNSWTIRDAGSDSHRIQYGGPLWLPAHGYLVLGRNADPAVNGGVPVAYKYSNFTLGNGADEIILLDGQGVEIDRVEYDGGPDFPNPNGAAMALITPDRDNALGQNWRAAFSPWPGSAGDLGSPAAANPIPPIGQIEGHVFEDLNGNRHRDVGEPGIPDVLITLSTGRSLRTFPSGWYGFYDLAPGVYEVTETQPTGYASTMPDRLTVTLAAAEVSLGHDFGETRLPASPTPTVTAGPSPTATPASRPAVLLSELLYDAPQTGTDTDFEWIEVYNASAASVDLAGWALRDNQSQDAIPVFTLGPGRFLVIAATAAGFAQNHPGFSGDLVTLEGSIGNGLSNTGDRVILLAPDGAEVDAMSYGDDAAGFDPPCPDVAAGWSLARVPADRDTDTAADWLPQAQPDPGGPGLAATPTPTPSLTPTATATMRVTATVTATATATSTGTNTPTATGAPTYTPTATFTAGPLPRIRLNELLPRPHAIDWDGDGVLDAFDEWIELFSLETAAVDLAGWALDDIAGGGSAPYIFPAGTILEPGGFLVRYRSTTRVALNQDADTARLLAPDGHQVDSFSYTNPRRDVSYSRMIDGVGDWTDAYPPSPGRANRAGTPTPAGTPTETPTATPTPTPLVYDRESIRLNEVLPRPAEVDWNGDGAATAEDEWVELFNRGSAPVDLSGWALDDIADGGSAPYIFPRASAAGISPADVVLAPGAYLLLFRSQTGVALNNDGDTVRLLGPDAAEVDSFSYTQPAADRAYARATDGDGPWTDAYPPSPGRANLPPTPTPTATATPTVTPYLQGVTLNEILPYPEYVDWDENGVANFTDEWIELYNAGPAAASLGGWALLDDTKTYTLPLGTVIWPRGYLLLFRAQTRLSLGDNHDQVTLRRPDGVVVDHFAYDRGPGRDRSYCRAVDGGGAWGKDCVETPGRANQLWPTPAPGDGGGGSAPGATQTGGLAPGSIAAARAAPPDTRVTVAGVVTLPPGLFGRSSYIQDETGGIQVYLRAGAYPALVVGDSVRVTGWTRDFHGEAEISVPNPSYLTWLGVGTPPVPLRVTTGQVGEAHEGRLVRIVGRVVRFEPDALTLDDGSGPARIYFPAGLAWRRPYVQIGEVWAAWGVVGQYAWDAPYTGGYRLIPRFPSDVAPPPAFLPVTGGG